MVNVNEIAYRHEVMAKIPPITFLLSRNIAEVKVNTPRDVYRLRVNRIDGIYIELYL